MRPEEQANEHERQLALAGDRVDAIKAYRNRVGCTLYDAKRAIDAAVPLEPRAAVPPFKQIRAELWARVYANEFAMARRLKYAVDAQEFALDAANQAVEDFDAYLERSKP